ncbi:leucine-rich repeat domain-containing protein, partial [Aquiluna sp.]|nr:leucine-rich repeat domain-containing protein [Aquiluna sp.]
LTSITIPNRVTSIALYAFNNATALTSVAFAGDAPTTSFWAFNNVGAGAVANIGSAATGFGSATTWNGLAIVRAGTVRCSTSGTFTVTDNVVTEGADCVGSAVIPNSVTSIGGDAFAGATSLTSLTIPDSVTSIGSYAFRNTSLTSITIPDSVTSISNFAFSRATALTSITIPDSVTSISNYAFWYATALTSVTIPDSVTSIGQGAFEGATALTSVTIPDSVTSIGQGAFWYTALTSITIPNSVTSIGNEAFSDTTALTSITIPDSVTSIGSYAFSDATALTSITIPDSVISIGQGAFDGATSLTLVTFAGNAPKTVGRDAFSSVGNDPVANIGIAAEDFGTATTWNGLRIVRAADPTPPTATPVSGDTNAGATLVIKGTNMDRITEVKIGGTVVPITARTTTSITVTVPAGLAVGNYSITLTTDDAAVLTGGFAQVVAGEVKAATNQKVNAGSFNTYVAVYAKGYKGQRLSWKIAGKWFKTILTKDYQVFQRKTIAVGLEVKVDLFIDGKRLLAKTVLTR